MPIKNHKLEDVRWDKALNVYGKITPEIIVLHDTAGRLDKFNSANYLRDHKKGISVHFVVERDGEITQQVPTNRRAGHAGTSSYHGRKDVNGFSIGIEIVNPGRLTKASTGFAKSWFGVSYRMLDPHLTASDLPLQAYDIQEVKTPEHGSGYWMGYTEAQIQSVLEICKACFDYYPSLKDIQPHWYISPGRKVDTNPLFPLAAVRSRILGRDEVAEGEADDAIDEIYSPDSMVTIHVPGSSLNMRRWPSFNPNVIATIPHGLDVPVLASGEFDERKWLKVIFDGFEGWVLAKYTSEDGGVK